MKRLFLDTNLILDLLVREEYKEDILRLIANSGGKSLFVSYLTVVNAAYIMRKYPRPTISKNISLILQLFDVVSNGKEQIMAAIEQETPDFEDMLQYQAALSAHCDVILTRNVKDFPFAQIPVMTVLEFLAK